MAGDAERRVMASSRVSAAGVAHQRYAHSLSSSITANQNGAGFQWPAVPGRRRHRSAASPDHRSHRQEAIANTLHTLWVRAAIGVKPLATDQFPGWALYSAGNDALHGRGGRGG